MVAMVIGDGGVVVAMVFGQGSRRGKENMEALCPRRKGKKFRHLLFAAPFLLFIHLLEFFFPLKST